MADKKIPDLPASSGLADVDLFEVVDDPAGTPVSQKATALQVAAYVHAETSDMTEATSMNATTDFLPARVGGNNRKVSATTLGTTMLGGTAKSGIELADRVIIGDSAASNVQKRGTVERILTAPSEAETSTMPTDPLIPIINDGNNTMISVSLPTLMKWLGGLGGGTDFSAFSGTIDGAADRLILYDNDAGVAYYITPNKLAGGKQTIWLPASAMKSRATSGAADGTLETSTNKNNYPTKDFDSAAKEYAQFCLAFPKSFNLGTLSFRAWWTATSGTAGVAWSMAARSFADGDNIDGAMGTAVVVTDALVTANTWRVSDESAAITIANTPGDFDLVQCEVAREVANGSDTLGVDAKLIGVQVYFTTDMRDDT